VRRGAKQEDELGLFRFFWSCALLDLSRKQEPYFFYSCFFGWGWGGACSVRCRSGKVPRATTGSRWPLGDCNPTYRKSRTVSTVRVMGSTVPRRENEFSGTHNARPNVVSLCQMSDDRWCQYVLVLHTPHTSVLKLQPDPVETWTRTTYYVPGGTVTTTRTWKRILTIPRTVLLLRVLPVLYCTSTTVLPYARVTVPYCVYELRVLYRLGPVLYCTFPLARDRRSAVDPGSSFRR
jgi:hypothetical protein